MERSDGGGGGMAPRGSGGGVVGSAAMLGLDMHLAPQQMHAFQQQAPPDAHHGGFQLQQVRQQQQQQQQPASFSPYSTNASSSMVVVSAAAVGHEDDMVGNGCGGKGVVVQQPQVAGCPWSRMKWTDAMVRLLIRVVHSVGDDGEGGVAAGGGGKAAKASHGHGHGPGHAAAAQQQKKGKWKSVSRAMMERSFVVSPQQCEDKFNDLNKRYKRVIDLLGRGRACRVVENHALLDTIEDIPVKSKDEARKLLSSKHLFFREMCAYHNSGGGGPHQPAHGAAAGADEACLHHPPPAPVAAARHGQHQLAAPSPPGMMKDSSADDDDDSDDVVVSNDNGGDDEDDFDEEAEEDVHNISSVYRSHGPMRSSSKRGRDGEDSATAADEDEADEDGGTKRARSTAATVDALPTVQQLRGDLAAASADPQQARCWVRRRAVEVEEEQVLVESRAHDLERQRLKWERFRANKEREMERARLENDRLRIEGRRMLLLLRQKDIELDAAEVNSSSVEHHHLAGQGQHHQQPIGSSPSTTGAGHP